MPVTIFDFSSIRAPITGIGRYAVELLKGQLAAQQVVYVVSQGNVYDSATAVSLTEKLQQTNNQTGHGTRAIVGSIPFSRDLYRSLQSRYFSNLAKDILSSGALYHDINYTRCDRAKKSITTVYDLSNIHAPTTHPKHRIHYLNRYFNKLAASKQAIITISESVKNELIHHYQITPERIHVTHLAADSEFKPRPPLECCTALEKYGLQYQSYILCVGTVEPRKNLKRVLDAYCTLDASTQARYPLVIAGPTGWKNSDLEKNILELHKRGLIKRLGFVAKADLPLLYSAAIAFVYPSLYEGFGLPLMEAMQSGCACISSNRGALLEVSAGSTREVDPENTESIASALSSILNDGEQRSRLSKLGLKRASAFSWANTVKNTQRIYETIE